MAGVGSCEVAPGQLGSAEYLQRGGRIGRAQAWVGQALSIKPVLIMKDGVIDQLAKQAAQNM
ncbi:DegV family protein [Saccharopolyspora mangrovi]|uniref:DegV family protein n=1 Tax=Saccharopolyspora mangrovi TaxID=3082379 RepID=A0ABU6A4S8_9PSEU|nr:DegV family protein [Saccharopolyspora sp. S2-29]MEB3366579.1 DegV family protein [Saccharopolyspora sp. S2-29]